ncbi:MAG: hypothetical protein ACK5LK_07870 [Chthoniobacterales bacterium]
MSACDALKTRLLAFINTSATDPATFDSLALAVFDHQRKNNPVYQKFCDDSLGKKSPDNWREIPALPLPAFRHAEVRSFPHEKTVKIFHTSGTTGDRYGQHFFENLDLYRAAAISGWKYAHLPKKNIWGLLPSPQEAPHSSLACMAGWLCSRDKFFLKNDKILLDTLRQACNHTETPICIFGTALAFLNLFEALKSPLALLPNSIAVETGGFKGSGREIEKADLYAKFEQFLGLSPDSIWNEYGMTELSSQAYTQGLGRPHQCPPWMRAQVIDPGTGHEVADGQIGVLKIFDLANIGSVLALQTRDLAIRRGENFELIGRDPNALPRGCSRSADEILNP